MNKVTKNPMRFQFQASDLVFHPICEETKQVQEVIRAAFPVDYEFVCASPRNQYQTTSTFDECVEKNLARLNCSIFDVPVPDKLEKKHDFACHIASKSVVFEVEKANWEKILYDLLKSHMYLASGADLAVLMLPKNWSHAKGEKDLFEIGKTRYEQAIEYGMGNLELFKRIMLVGFNQYYSGKLYASSARENIRQQCKDYFNGSAV